MTLRVAFLLGFVSDGLGLGLGLGRVWRVGDFRGGVIGEKNVEGGGAMEGEAG